MKTFLGLGGLFLLLSLVWTCAGDWSAILVQCSSTWIYARITPTIFYNVHMDYDEVFLGDGCPVTHYLPNRLYEFLYDPSACGIETKILQEVVLLKTKIKYISKNSTSRSEMPLSCFFCNQNPYYTNLERSRNETGNISESETEVRINMANEDMGAASATCSCQNPNVEDPDLPDDATLP